MRWSLSIIPSTVVPLGLPDFNGKAGIPFLTFKIHIREPFSPASKFEIFAASGTLLFVTPLDEIVAGPGTYSLAWDGFDLNEVFDSRTFLQPLEARMSTSQNPAAGVSVFFKGSYAKVKWVDIVINRPLRKIDAVLRTCFSNGGKFGTEERTRTYHELIQLAIDGLGYHWGRNAGRREAKSVNLPSGEKYEFYLHAENVSRNAIKSPKIIYHTNSNARRSRNWELSRILFYNTGKLKYKDQWYHISDQKADADFKQIAAHEIGHEILLAYGGHIYSKGHKGSSTILTQRPLGNFFYPAGEIDLMIYYKATAENPYPSDYNGRNAASETDVLALIWLSQLKIVQWP